MKAENTTTGHNRTLRITGIPGELKELIITVNYTSGHNDGNKCGKAIALDNVVIPAILVALNTEQVVSRAEHEDALWG